MSGIGVKNIIVLVKVFGSQDHQDGIGTEITHRMPIGGFQYQALVGPVQQESGGINAVVVIDMAGSLNANGRLPGLFMPVPAPGRVIDSIDIENASYIERNTFFNNSKVSTLIGK